MLEKSRVFLGLSEKNGRRVLTRLDALAVHPQEQPWEDPENIVSCSSPWHTTRSAVSRVLVGASVATWLRARRRPKCVNQCSGIITISLRSCSSSRTIRGEFWQRRFTMWALSLSFPQLQGPEMVAQTMSRGSAWNRISGTLCGRLEEHRPVPNTGFCPHIADRRNYTAYDEPAVPPMSTKPQAMASKSIIETDSVDKSRTTT